MNDKEWDDWDEARDDDPTVGGPGFDDDGYGS